MYFPEDEQHPLLIFHRVEPPYGTQEEGILRNAEEGPELLPTVPLGADPVKIQAVGDAKYPVRMEAGPNFLCVVRCQTAEGQPVIAEGLQQRRVFLPQHAEIPLQGGMEGVEHPAPGKVQSVYVIREGVKMDHIRLKFPDDLIESPVEPHSPGGLFGGQTQLRFPGARP